jgi:hypothetical protein
MGQLLFMLVGVLGVFIVIANWAIVYDTYVRKRPRSWVPLLGGLCVAVGATALPVRDVQGYLWIPFVADYGCLPALLHMGWIFLTGRHRGRR